MIKTAICILAILAGSVLYGQEPAKQQAAKFIFPAGKVVTPDTEAEAAIVHLNKMDKYDAEYIRFFTTYAVEKERRDSVILTLSFVIHSLAGISPNADESAGGFAPLAIRTSTVDKDATPIIIPIRRVKDSETLWWIDLRDYNWTPEAWEKVSELDGYFVDPVIDYQKYSVLKLLSGNAILRADWFILHATDMSKQADTDRKTRIYDTLLYAKQKIPTNVEEWRKIWGVDVKQAQTLGADSATLVSKSKEVSRDGNRMLFGYRTPLGYYYDTYDTKNLEGFRDYTDNIVAYKGRPPTIYDGGESFATNHLGLQVYALRNQKEELVPFADATIVRHLGDALGDARVITARSCIDCHAAGPIVAENTFREFIDQGSKAKTVNKNDALRIKRVFLNGKFEEGILDNQAMFARALKRANGLTPEENNKLFLEAIIKYDTPLTVEQAAIECGLTVDEFRQKVKNISSARVLNLIGRNGEPIPRQVWETPGADGNPGLFQQCMVVIKGLPVKITDTIVEDKTSTRYFATVIAQAQVKITDIKTRQEKVLGTVNPGDKLEVVEARKDSWTGVLINGETGYILTRFLEAKE